jgi:hypothetical protein
VASALSPWSGIQSVEIRREMLSRALDAGKVVYAGEDDPLPEGIRARLLSHGKILLSPRLKDDIIGKLRAIFHEETEAVLQILEKQDRGRYSSLINMVLSEEAAVKAYVDAFHMGMKPEFPDEEALCNDILARAFELLILIENDAISPREMTSAETIFIREISPVIDSHKHSYFTGIFWDQRVREINIRFALASGQKFREAAQSVSDGVRHGASVGDIVSPDEPDVEVLISQQGTLKSVPLVAGDALDDRGSKEPGATYSYGTHLKTSFEGALEENDPLMEFMRTENPILELIRKFTEREGATVWADIGPGYGIALRQGKAIFRDKLVTYGVDPVNWFEQLKKDPKAFENFKAVYGEALFSADNDFIKLHSRMEAVLLPEPADLITAYRSLQYSYSPIGTIKQLYNQLKPGGIMIVAGPLFATSDIIGLSDGHLLTKRIVEELNAAGIYARLGAGLDSALVIQRPDSRELDINLKITGIDRISGGRMTMARYQLRDAGGSLIQLTGNRDKAESNIEQNHGISFFGDPVREPKEQKKTLRGGRSGSASLYGKFLAALLSIAGLAGVYKIAQHGAERNIEMHRYLLEVLDGIDISRPYVFSGEAEMLEWLSGLVRRVELGLEYFIKEDGTHIVYFMSVGDAHFVNVHSQTPKGRRRIIHTHPAGMDITEQIPSLTDLVAALDEHVNIIILAEGRAVKLTFPENAEHNSFARILKEGDARVRSFMKQKNLTGPGMAEDFLVEILDRVLFREISNWDIFYLGAGDIDASFYNPNAWGHMAGLLGFSVIEFLDGNYSNMWDLDTATRRKTEILKAEGDRYYEEYKRSVDEILNDKYRDMTIRARSWIEGDAAITTILALAAGSFSFMFGTWMFSTIGSGSPHLGALFSITGLLAGSFLTGIFRGKDREEKADPYFGRDPGTLGDLKGTTSYHRAFLGFLGFDMNSTITRVGSGPGFGVIFSEINTDNVRYVSRLLGQVENNGNIALLIDLRSEEPLAMFYESDLSPQASPIVVSMHRGHSSRVEKRLKHFFGFEPYIVSMFRYENGLTVFPSIYEEASLSRKHFSIVRGEARDKKRILVIGSGTGADIQALWEIEGIEEIVATEIDALGMVNTKFTVSELRANSKIHKKVSFYHGKDLDGLGKFDLITFVSPLAITSSVAREGNPFLIKERFEEKECHGIAFDPGGKVVFPVIAKAAERLKTGGSFLLMNHDADEVDAVLKKNGFSFAKEFLAISKIGARIVTYTATLPFGEMTQIDLPFSEADHREPPETRRDTGIETIPGDDFFSSLEGFRRALSGLYDRAVKNLEKVLASNDKTAQSLILYADDILKSIAVADLEETMIKITSSKGMLDGGHIVLFSRDSDNGIILERMIKKVSPGTKTHIVAQKDLQQRRNLNGKEANEIEVVVREARRNGAGEIVALIKGPAQDSREDSPEDLVEISRKLKLPVIILGLENALYSFASAIEQAVLIKNQSGRNGWVVSLIPIQTISADIQRKHEEYLATLRAQMAV